MIPSSAQTELAKKLRSLRSTKGLTTYELAARTGISQSKIVKLENSKLKLKPADIHKIANALDLRDSVRTSLVEDARQIRLTSRYASLREWSNPRTLQTEALNAETDAALIRVGSDEVLPAWLQTHEYMANTHQTSPLSVSLSQFMEARITRQARTFREGKQYQCIIDERVLISPLLHVRQWIAQLDFLKQRNRRPGVEIGVLPLGCRKSRNGFTYEAVDSELILNEVGRFNETVIPITAKNELEAQLAEYDQLAKSAVWEGNTEKLIDEAIARLSTVDVRFSKT